jgi:catecholate siderophore receptor
VRFRDERTADRGVPSYRGLPFETDPSMFFGAPDKSSSRAVVSSIASSVHHTFGGVASLSVRVSLADYDKFYQNVYPTSAVDATGTRVDIGAYNNATSRTNLFSQTDLVVLKRTGRFEHTLLAGVELGRQATDNYRNTGYFTSVSPTTTTISVPAANPITSAPVTFRQSATDADNQSTATIAAVYIQDQLDLSRTVKAILGVRYDRFSVDLDNRRTGASLASRDGLTSPRLAVVYKPVTPVSLYGTYTMSYLPRAGEQLSSLTITNQAMTPETFTNYELGAKWQIGSALSMTAAAYQLDRGNVAVPDPVDPTQSILVDGQRARGIELDLGGNVTSAWGVTAAYAYQHGEITRTQSATVQAGATLAQLPRHAFSLWNRYHFGSRWGIGLGVVHRTNTFVSTDNTVTLPGFIRIDGAAFFAVNSHLRGQVNVENVLDRRYSLFAHNNNNITPGAPRAFRASIAVRF